MEGFEQKVSQPDKWLYIENNGYRHFYKAISMPKWCSLLPECTNEEKLAWEEAHKPEEPQQAEEQATE